MASARSLRALAARTCGSTDVPPSISVAPASGQYFVQYQLAVFVHVRGGRQNARGQIGERWRSAVVTRDK